MQYILSEDEYKKLVNRPERDLTPLRELVVNLNEGQCIHNKGNPLDYCEDCPLQKLPGELLHAVCTLEKHYSD